MAESNYILSATPDQPNRVKNIFHLGPSPRFVSGILEEPGAFRNAGWDMQTLDRARIRNGEFLELRNGPRKTLRLYEDGTFILRGEINGNFLGWSQEGEFERNPRLHTLAVIEFTTAFVYLYSQILPFLELEPQHVWFHLEIANGKIGDRFLYLIPYPVDSTHWVFNDDSSRLCSENPKDDVKIDTGDLQSDPDRVAFQLAERLFLFFSVGGNQIPYTTEQDGIQRINIDLIKRIH